MTSTWLRLQLWMLTGVLCVIGLTMITSITAAKGGGGDAGTAMAIKQAMYMAVGVVLAAVVSFASMQHITALRSVLFISVIAVLSLLLVLAVGRSINGAKRWLELGFFNIQPAEIAKLAVVLAGAWWFTHVAERVRASWEGVLVPIIGFAVLGGLVFATKDLGSVVVMGTCMVGLMLFSGANIWYFGALGASALPLFSFIAVFQEAYRKDRMAAFIEPWTSDGPAGHHLRQNLIALGSGGLTGAGLGESMATLGFVPEAHTDSIYAVIGADFGLVGTLTVAGLFVWLTVVGLIIAWRCGELQGRLIAIGCTLLLATQAFWHMLVDVGGVPTKGLTLPFISYGGSSVVICMLLIGCLDAIARAADVAVQATTRARGAVIHSRSRWNEVRGRAA